MEEKIKAMLGSDDYELQDLGMVLLKANYGYTIALENMKMSVHPPYNILFDPIEGVSSLEIERPTPHVWGDLWKMKMKVDVPFLQIKDPTKTLIFEDSDKWTWKLPTSTI